MTNQSHVILAQKLITLITGIIVLTIFENKHQVRGVNTREQPKLLMSLWQLAYYQKRCFRDSKV